MDLMANRIAALHTLDTLELGKWTSLGSEKPLTVKGPWMCPVTRIQMPYIESDLCHLHSDCSIVHCLPDLKLPTVRYILHSTCFATVSSFHSHSHSHSISTRLPVLLLRPGSFDDLKRHAYLRHFPLSFLGTNNEQTFTTSNH